jgi:HEAT repeat protein
MLWMTLRQLKTGTAGSRRKAAQQLSLEPNPRALNALAAAALTDPDAEVRRLAAAALGRLDHPGRYEPLIGALEDRNPDVIRSAMLGLRRATSEQVMRALVRMLRHQDFSVRTSAAQTIDTIRWAPRDREERLWFQIAKGWYERAAASGGEAIPALQLTIETGPVPAAVRAVEALGLISDPRVIKLLRGALQSQEPAVRIAAADALGKVGGAEAVGALTSCLHSSQTQVRVASVQALGILRAAEATGAICKLLRDKEWEVRQEAAVALGRLTNAEAVEPLSAVLEDADSDVRESAAMALGRIGDRRGVGPLILTLRDEVTSVRRIAAAALARIDPEWASLPETREAAEKLKLAIQDAEPAIRFFVSQLLVNLGALSPEAMFGLAPEDQLASPAVKRKRMATHLFIGLLEDPDRDLRQTAAEALGHLGGERARQALTRTARDLDGDVAAAIQMALQALGTESTN